MTPNELIEFTGATGPNVKKQAEQALAMANGLVEAYTRGRHKSPAGELRPGVSAVVVAVAARILANPEQIQVREQIGPYTMLRGPGFSGFTLAELAVLNRYRKRAI